MPNESLRVPSWCPICQSFMKDNKSVNTYYNAGCCIHCFIQFVEGREARWKAGWRPSDDEIKVLIDELDSSS